MRHWLPASHGLTPLIARHLLARGPLAEVKEEVYLVGRSERLADRLRAAGWTVQAAEIGAEPRIEIFAPDQTLRWSGHFGEADLGETGAVVLDTVVLEKVAQNVEYWNCPFSLFEWAELGGNVFSPNQWAAVHNQL